MFHKKIFNKAIKGFFVYNIKKQKQKISPAIYFRNK